MSAFYRYLIKKGKAKTPFLKLDYMKIFVSEFLEEWDGIR